MRTWRVAEKRVCVCPPIPTRFLRSPPYLLLLLLLPRDPPTHRPSTPPSLPLSLPPSAHLTSQPPSMAAPSPFPHSLSDNLPCFSPSFPSLHSPPQPPSQLTIFYSGTVNVYDNIPSDKAHAIMLLLGSCKEKGSDGSSVNPISTGANQDTATGEIAVSAAGTSKTIGTGLQTLSSAFTPPPSPLTISQSEKKPQLVCRRSQAELPYARKASLARFLEKRKERVQVVQENEAEEDACKDGSKKMKLTEE